MRLDGKLVALGEAIDLDAMAKLLGIKRELKELRRPRPRRGSLQAKAEADGGGAGHT